MDTNREYTKTKYHHQRVGENVDFIIFNYILSSEVTDFASVLFLVLVIIFRDIRIEKRLFKSMIIMRLHVLRTIVDIEPSFAFQFMRPISMEMRNKFVHIVRLVEDEFY